MAMEQLQPLRNRVGGTSDNRIRVGGTKAREGRRATRNANRTTPLKPTEGLNGPPADLQIEGDTKWRAPRWRCNEAHGLSLKSLQRRSPFGLRWGPSLRSG